jgi:glycosyltransferase EpsJ
LVDDGSTDGSGRICLNYAVQDERVVYYKKQNEGVAKARNFGIHQTSQGASFVCFVDSDDYVHPLYLEYLVAAIGKAQFSMCRFKDIYDDCQSLPNQQLISVTQYNDIQKNPKFVERFHSGILNSPCNKLYRLDIIRNSSIRFPQDSVIAEDLFFNLAYLQYCSSVNEVENALYFYCHRDGSLVSHIDPQAYECYHFIRDKMISFWGDKYKDLIDMMIYRQVESISIKLIEQNRSKEVKYYVSQLESQELFRNVHLSEWNDRLIHFLLVHKWVSLLNGYITFLNRNGKETN